MHPNRAQQISDQQDSLQVQLKKLPNVKDFTHADSARFNFFTKKVWDGLYEKSKAGGGYTILFVPDYFEFVRIRTYLKNKNANVCFISEYSEKKSCQRSRHYYEQGKKSLLVITERAIIFEKIRLRYARSIFLYGLPESQDTLVDCLAGLFDSENWKPILNTKLNQIKLQKEKSKEEKEAEARQLLQEKHH
mmetsp:Transcript_17190/g.28958  ORF Transcript_17190/g.28958 Transcript_17190/m.28958 type:complete len:191 (-) Transcript_17190:173-745(-)